ncbi:MAG TPA: tripartite tricarboxylate transporter TctB family protein [Syntrophorhabdales bacterium]|nr:tripartite tricarboxylate transporter TctB family protein [Syntrophorhabdales bacterium]
MSRELKAGIFFLVISVLVIWESVRVDVGTLKEPGPGFLSFCVGIVLFGLSIVLVGRGRRVREKGTPHSGRVLLALASLFAYSLVLGLAGFVAATFFLVAALLQLGQSRRWWWLAGVSGLVTFAAYFVFGALLHVYFPRGFLGI